MSETVKKIIGQTFDEERALYALSDAEVIDCRFAGAADGESCLKESRNILVNDCDFELRYPLWHTENTTVINSRFTETCRAGIWYTYRVNLENCIGNGIKAVRECRDIDIKNCEFDSPEFGWICDRINIENSKITSEYFLLNSKNITASHFTLYGKYSFQYTENVTVTDSVLNTKDAFWNSKNVTVKNSVINGEYLGWYAENLRLINCDITGTQPLCYCKNLYMENCRMINCDLSFEYSTLNADIKGSIDSIKNPESGRISAGKIDNIIIDEYAKQPLLTEIIETGIM